MEGFVQSFNLSVSVALCLYHFRYVLGFLKAEGNMGKEELEQLKCRLLLKNCFVRDGKKEASVMAISEELKKHGIDFGADEIKQFIMYGIYLDHGNFTGKGMGCPLTPAITFFTVISAIVPLVASVALPISNFINSFLANRHAARIRGVITQLDKVSRG